MHQNDIVNQNFQSLSYLGELSPSNMIQTNAQIPSPAPTFGDNGNVNQTQSVKPKRPVSSFNLFKEQMLSQMTLLEKFKPLSDKHKMRIISDSWGQLAPDHMQQYIRLAQADRERYQKECNQLQNQGFFVNKEGKSSIDPSLAEEMRSSSSDIIEIDGENPSSKKVLNSNTNKMPFQVPVQYQQEEIYDEVVRPKRTCIEFFWYIKETFKTIKEQNPGMQNGQIQKIIAANWHKLTDEEKQPFVQKRKDDSLRYQREMTEFKEKGFFINSDGVDSSTLKAKKKIKKCFRNMNIDKLNQQAGRQIGQKVKRPSNKAPGAPKQAKCSFMYFVTDYHNSKMGDNHKKAVGEKWRNLSEDEKRKYVMMAEKDKERCMREKIEFNKQGYFINENGVKSTDVVQK